MKKILLYVCIAIGMLLLLLVVCKTSGVLSYCQVATVSNEPTLKRQTLFFTSSVVKPKRYDFITFHHIDAAGGKVLWVFRLCGLPGDKVQIVNGDLWVNGMPTDTLFETYHNYLVDKAEYALVQGKTELPEDAIRQLTADTIMVPLTKKQVAAYKIAVRPAWHYQDLHQEVSALYHEKWTANNFGPLTIPAGNYFVLGDNRDDALDSRFSGLVSEENFAATVIR